MKTIARKHKVGFLNIADSRLGPEMHKNIIDASKNLSNFISSEDFEVVEADNVIDSEKKAYPVVEAMRNDGCIAIVVRIAWFHRSNVCVGIAQKSSLPLMICALPNPDDTGFEGLVLAHGALDEIGIQHQINFGTTDKKGSSKIIAWLKACGAKVAFQGAIYGEIGGRCLEMLPGSSDPNQLRKIFGIHIDPLEQWTLIRRAETIRESQWKPVVEAWRKAYKAVEASDLTLERSAKLYLAGNEIFKEREWDFAGIQCQLEMIDNYLAPCMPVAQWNEDGFTVSCETDINNALGMYLIQEVSGKPAMFCDIFHYNTESNIIHALNCGTAAPSLAGGEKNICVHEQTPLQGTWDEENQSSKCQGGACNQFILPPGSVTVLRFGRIDGEYVIQVTEGKAIEHDYNPKEVGGLTAVWPFAYIKLNKEVIPENFIQNMRSHHAVIAKGHCEDVIREFAKLTKIRVLS